MTHTIYALKYTARDKVLTRNILSQVIYATLYYEAELNSAPTTEKNIDKLPTTLMLQSSYFGSNPG